jgi:5-methylcytosine-specific restriction endonuclease McrA
MNFKSISNDELLEQLKARVENERKLLMEILYALREVEARKLHLEVGYPDLYEFAMKELGYSSGAAYRRISAMRLLQAVPDVALRLESGELGLENASQAQSFFRKEDQRRKELGGQKLSLDEKREIVTELLGKSTREGQRVLMERSPEVMMPSEKTRPLSEQKTLVQFVASGDLMNKLEDLKHLLAHKNFEGRLDVLIDQLADMALSKLRPKSEDLPIVRSSSPAPGMQRRSRYIPVAEKRKVLLRDQSGCTYEDSRTGKVCQSRHGLQLDHIVPFSCGGQNTAENLTLRCGAHNRFRAEQIGLFRPGVIHAGQGFTSSEQKSASRMGKAQPSEAASSLPQGRSALR